MKYSIQETKEKAAPYELYRYDQYAGIPNNAELEFWMRVRELEVAIKNIQDNSSYSYHSQEYSVDKKEFENLINLLPQK